MPATDPTAAAPAVVGGRAGAAPAVDAATAGPGVPTPFALDLVLADGRRLHLRVAELGLACCAVELVAAAVRGTGGFGPAGGTPAAAEDLHVLVVSGTVTDKLVPALRRLLDALPEPRRVVSFGACANCGGPYWDSYSVTKGVDQVLPVDVWVPGCPPRPEALLHGLQRLLDGPPAATPAGPPAAAPGRPLTAPLVGPAGPVRPDGLTTALP